MLDSANRTLDGGPPPPARAKSAKIRHRRENSSSARRTRNSSSRSRPDFTSRFPPVARPRCPSPPSSARRRTRTAAMRAGERRPALSIRLRPAGRARARETQAPRVARTAPPRHAPSRTAPPLHAPALTTLLRTARAASRMLISTALVQLMTPGVALFYGGLVSEDAAVSTMMLSFGVIGVVTVRRTAAEGGGRARARGAGERAPAGERVLARARARSLTTHPTYPHTTPLRPHTCRSSGRSSASRSRLRRTSRSAT